MLYKDFFPNEHHFSEGRPPLFRPERIADTCWDTLLQKGEVDKAIAHYQKALEINPKDFKEQANLTWALAICPETLKGAIAVKLAQHANQIAGGANPMILQRLRAKTADPDGSSATHRPDRGYDRESWRHVFP